MTLLVTSQRPLGALRGEPEETYLVHRIESPATCLHLFAAASGSPLGDRAQSEEVRAVVDLLDGHPRSLVLVAGQIRDGGANVPSILARLQERGDEAVLAADLLESGTDWTDDDRLRAERLVSSLHLAYRPLLEHAPGAAELFAWLGTLPAGLPVALASAIFGDDAPERIATLSRFSLVELRGADERLDSPAPVRWYAARRLEMDVPRERQAELLARTLDAIGSLMAAAYELLGKPGAGVVVDMSRREALNLEAILRRLEQRPPAILSLNRLAAGAFWRWSRVREYGGNNAQQVMLIERAIALLGSLDSADVDYASLVYVLGDLYRRTDRLADAEDTYRKALAAFIAIDDRFGEANTGRSLGDLYFRADRLADARGAYSKALAIFTAIGDPLGEANTLRALGDFHLRTDRLSDVEDAYSKALAIFIAVDDRLGEANTRKALGDLYVRTPRLADAEDAYSKALTAFDAIDDRLGKANTLLAIGDLYVRTARLTDAKDAYRKALAAFAAFGERLGEANTISALGMLAIAQARPAEGFEQLRSARMMLLAIDARLSAAGQLGYMARAATAVIALDRAIVLAGMARQELRTLDDHFGVVLAGQDLIEAALQAKNKGLAMHAIVLTWHYARAIEHSLAKKLVDGVAIVLPPEKIATGLDPDEVDALEHSLAAAVAEVAKRLEDAGEDPFGPLPSPPPSPPPEEP